MLVPIVLQAPKKLKVSISRYDFVKVAEFQYKEAQENCKTDKRKWEKNERKADLSRHVFRSLKERHQKREYEREKAVWFTGSRGACLQVPWPHFPLCSRCSLSLVCPRFSRVCVCVWEGVCICACLSLCYKTLCHSVCVWDANVFSGCQLPKLIFNLNPTPVGLARTGLDDISVKGLLMINILWNVVRIS